MAYELIFIFLLFRRIEFIGIVGINVSQYILGIGLLASFYFSRLGTLSSTLLRLELAGHKRTISNSHESHFLWLSHVNGFTAMLHVDVKIALNCFLSSCTIPLT